MCPTLLVTDEHMVQLRVRRQVLVERQVGTARVPEDRAHPLGEEALEDDLCAGEHALLGIRLGRVGTGAGLDHL
jgi:hypothetical protein